MKFLNKIDGADKLITDANNRLVKDTDISNWNNKAEKTDIPTKLSELTKDINFDERYYTETEIDTKLAGKVDKVSGKGLSTNDFTNVYKNKLDGIEEGANKYTHPSTHPASMITESTSRRFVSDSEKVTWNNKQDALGYTPVNKAGDTMTGSLALTGSIFDTEFKADNWNLINKYTGGGWARGLLNVKNKDGTNYIQIGGLGSGQNFTRLYIGKAWNDWLLGVNPNNNTVEIRGNLTKNNKEVATKDEIPTKLSALIKDINFDERYYTETEIDTKLGNVQNYGIATQAEAEAGSINNKYMTPLRTRQAVENVLGTIEKGTKIITSPTEPTGLTTGDQWHKEY